MTDTLEQAVADAQFVQESAPEKLDLKRDLLARLDAATPPGVVIASSTSGYPMTDMQTAAADPSRLVVGHPFNPPYLIPLVEVVGGERTDAAAVAWASRFYEVAGKSVITMDHEVPGFIANRLQEACGGRRCTWSRPVRRRSGTSTCRSPRGPGCAGR